ncbi:MAG: DNA cytosine methyltransferase [Flavobacteriaceae bacterium]|nr:DNA cytosine methyltransferase [Flavobacteriaceae bacterium]
MANSLKSKDTLSITDKAILSHYFHNENSNGYKKDALKIIEKLNQKEIDSFIKKIKKNNQFLSKKQHEFTFIDLFAGIGGFRIALQNLGGKCIFTSEWDKNAQETYFNNFGDFPFGDITLKETKNAIPEKFDVLCAGFPCQAFSKGGHQKGFEDTRGTLFFDLCEIIKKHQPKYLFLENVANLVSHDKGNTFKIIRKNLDELGYYFPDKSLIISPDKFGIPILRPRVFIPCVRKDIANAKDKGVIIKNFEIELAKKYTDKIKSIYSITSKNSTDKITDYEERVLIMWDEFYQGIDLKIIGFPIWSAYFKFSKSLANFPIWKVKFIQKNIDLYQRNKIFIDKWLVRYNNLDWCIKTHTKMEWQAGKDYNSIWDCLIQFRPSGVRVRRPNLFSTLVAMNHRQIIGKYKRRISINESKKLQSFPIKYKLPKTNATALKQLGNSVNVKVIQHIFATVLENYKN